MTELHVDCSKTQHQENPDLISTQGMSIPVNVNIPISSFNRCVVELEDIVGQQTEKAFSNSNIKTNSSFYNPLLRNYTVTLTQQNYIIS